MTMLTKLKYYLESKEFYNVMQTYRVASVADQGFVTRAFEQVKESIIEACNADTSGREFFRSRYGDRSFYNPRNPKAIITYDSFCNIFIGEESNAPLTDDYKEFMPDRLSDWLVPEKK